MREHDELARLDQKLRTVFYAVAAFIIFWCIGTAAVFGFAVSTPLVYIGGAVFVVWMLVYLYVIK